MSDDLLKNKIDLKKLPKHIAAIMDGNGRWAKSQGHMRVFGHKNGVKSVREITEACAELGVSYLTLYAFSTENWERPQYEVNALMALLVDTIGKEMKTLQDNNIKLNSIGNIDKLPAKTQKALLKGIEDTKNNDRMTLTLALNYSSRWELTQTMRKIAEKVKSGLLEPEAINSEVIQNHLATHNIPE